LPGSVAGKQISHVLREANWQVDGFAVNGQRVDVFDYYKFHFRVILKNVGFLKTNVPVNVDTTNISNLFSFSYFIYHIFKKGKNGYFVKQKSQGNAPADK
jgi:hypothetical protein